MELHRAAYHGDVAALTALLKKTKDPLLLAERDTHGHTPLHLAVMLGHTECADALIKAGASVQPKLPDGWPIVAEAVSRGEPDLVDLVQKRDVAEGKARFSSLREHVIRTLAAEPDFRMEIDWEVHCWVPLVDRLLPSDTIVLEKNGACLRVDSTLLDMSEKTLKRGNTSVLIDASDKGHVCIYDVEHDSKEYSRIKFEGLQTEFTEEDRHWMLCTETADADLKGKGATCERALAGVYGFRQEKSEAVAGYMCDVYHFSGMALQLRKRSEHLTPKLKEWNKAMKAKAKEGKLDFDADPPPFESLPAPPRATLSFDEYLAASPAPRLGRPKQEKKTVKAAKATLWMSKDYPLSMERFLALLESLEPVSEQLATLRRFLSNTLPEGFPVKLEIPIFPTVSARVTFKSYELGSDASRFVVPEDYERVEKES